MLMLSCSLPRFGLQICERLGDGLKSAEGLLINDNVRAFLDLPKVGTGWLPPRSQNCVDVARCWPHRVEELFRRQENAEMFLPSVSGVVSVFPAGCIERLYPCVYLFERTPDEWVRVWSELPRQNCG